MRHVLSMGIVLLSAILWASGAWAAGPYLQLEAGVLSRDVMEDVAVVQDSEVVGFKFKGEAVSTRVLAKAGIELWELMTFIYREEERISLLMSSMVMMGIWRELMGEVCV